jgi:hypothetical protein
MTASTFPAALCTCLPRFVAPRRAARRLCEATPVPRVQCNSCTHTVPARISSLAEPLPPREFAEPVLGRRQRDSAPGPIPAQAATLRPPVEARDVAQKSILAIFLEYAVRRCTGRQPPAYRQAVPAMSDGRVPPPRRRRRDQSPGHPPPVALRACRASLRCGSPRRAAAWAVCLSALARRHAKAPPCPALAPCVAALHRWR